MRRLDLHIRPTPDTACLSNLDAWPPTGTAASHPSHILGARTWLNSELAQDTGALWRIWLAQAEVAQAWTSAIGWAQARQSPRYLRRNLVKGTALAGMPPCGRLLNDDREDRGMVKQGLVFAVEVVTPAMPGHTEARCGKY